MISVRNRLPRLSGNRWLLFLVTVLIAAACSPKVQPVAVHQPVKKAPEQPAIRPEKKEVAAAAPKVSTIALLLPFGLNHLAPGESYTSSSLREADIALGYYQGFKLALDSLTAQGYNYKLLVLDSRGQKEQAHALASNPTVQRL